jgi:hypothetical protein
MTEQNRKYIRKEIGRILSDIWQVKGLAEQVVHTITYPEKTAINFGIMPTGRLSWLARRKIAVISASYPWNLISTE